MISFRLDDREVQDTLNLLRRRISDITPAMREVGSSLVDEIRLGFTDSREPWGHAWAPLSEVTQSMDNERRRGGQPLLDTGKLRNSITFRADRQGVEVGTSDLQKKALTHQFGSWNAWGRGIRVPPRPFLPILQSQRANLPPDWEDEVLETIRRHIAGAGTMGVVRGWLNSLFGRFR